MPREDESPNRSKAGVVVEVDNLHKTYEPSPLWMRALVRTAIREPVLALDGISLQVRPGEICAIIGENGAGKSTLFRILTGLTTPTKGSAHILGLDVTSKSTAVRRSIGFMPAEQRSLLLRQTCWENLMFHGALHGMSKSDLKQRIAATLEMVGLAAATHRSAFALSSGMTARLMLARALLHRPPVLILDEPTGAVDPVGSYQIVEIIQRLASEEGIAVLISSHRLDEIEALHDHVILLHRGRAIFSGDLDRLRTLWERPRYELEFLDANSRAAAMAIFQQINNLEVEPLGDRGMIVFSELGLGELLRPLNGYVGSLASANESRIRLQELLSKIILAHRANESAAE